MRRVTCFFSLLCGLALLANLRALADTLADSSPGWVIVLAADYKGPSGELYKSVQSDAQNAVITAARDWKVPADHVLLLAEGDDIQKFAQSAQKDKNFAFVPRPKDDATMDAMLAGAEGDPAMALRITQFRNNFPAKSDPSLPYFSEPTAINFKIARDIVARLARPDQFVVIVVSTSRAKADPQAESPDSKQVVLLEQHVPGKIDARDCLSASDFAMPGCQARYRLMLIDASNGGNVIKGAQLPLPPAPDLGGAITPWDIGILEDALGTVQAGADKNAVVPIVMASSQNMNDAVAQTDATGAFAKTGSVFLRTVFDRLRQDTNATLKDCFDKVSEQVNAKARSIDRTQVPVLRAAATAADLPVSAIFSRKADAAVTTTEPLQVSDIPITGKPLHNPGSDDLLGVVMVGDNILVKMPKVGNISGPDRAKKVADRLNELRAHLKTTPADVSMIRVGQLPDKSWVVEAPITDKWIITADPEFARMSNRKPVLFAKDLAARVCKALNLKIGLPPAPDLGGAPDQDLTTEEMVNAALLNYDNWKNKHNPQSLQDAIDLLNNARDKDATYAEAYLELAHIYLETGKKDEAGRVLLTLQKTSENLKSLTPDQKATYNQLQEALK